MLLERNSTCSATRPYVIKEPQAIAAVVKGVTIKPTGKTAAWQWPNKISFILDDGRKITTGISGFTKIFGVHLPGARYAVDCVLTPELSQVISPHLDRAIEHYKKSCPKWRVPPGANGRSPSREEPMK